MTNNNLPLVSIVSPCWNSEGFIHRMLDSILLQTYTNIEMICIDDGSTDNTYDILKGYIDSFHEKGMILRLVKQENCGQAAAVNNGLKMATGKYLSWIDSDDYLLPHSIEKKVNILEKNQDYAIVTSDCWEVKEVENCIAKDKFSRYFGRMNYQSNQFYLTLTGKSLILSGCHLIRMDCFDKAVKNREINTCKEGQNLQLLLPVLYHYKRYYLDEPLMCYVIRNNSHYHSVRSFEQKKNRHKSMLNMVIDTLERIGLSQREIEKCINMSMLYLEGI